MPDGSCPIKRSTRKDAAAAAAADNKKYEREPKKLKADAIHSTAKVAEQHPIRRRRSHRVPG